MADKNTLRNWFLTNLKPTQAQFWALFDSYFHKDEKIPITAIDDIENILADKADAEVLAHHLTDETAHTDLFLAKEDKTNKGVAGGYVPLNEFAKIANEYLTIVNDLVTGGPTSLASAETVKMLKTQIDDLTAVAANKEPAITGGAAGQYYSFDKTWVTIPVTDISGKQDIANQVEVSTSQSAQASWHGKTVIFTANCTITIPAALVDSYIFNGITLPGVTVSWAITAPKTWLFGTALATTEKQIFTVTQRGNTNSILLVGV